MMKERRGAPPSPSGQRQATPERQVALAALRARAVLRSGKVEPE